MTKDGHFEKSDYDYMIRRLTEGPRENEFDQMITYASIRMKNENMESLKDQCKNFINLDYSEDMGPLPYPIPPLYH